jgi:hypothetical protein
MNGIHAQKTIRVHTVNPRYNDSQCNDFRIITMRYAGTVDFMCRITINPVYRYRKDLASNLAGIVISRRAGSMLKPIISQFSGVNLGADAPEL